METHFGLRKPAKDRFGVGAYIVIPPHFGKKPTHLVPNLGVRCWFPPREIAGVQVAPCVEALILERPIAGYWSEETYRDDELMWVFKAYWWAYKEVSNEIIPIKSIRSAESARIESGEIWYVAARRYNSKWQAFLSHPDKGEFILYPEGTTWDNELAICYGVSFEGWHLALKWAEFQHIREYLRPIPPTSCRQVDILTMEDWGFSNQLEIQRNRPLSGFRIQPRS